MSERLFRVEGTRQVTQQVTAWIRAEDFDEAGRMFDRGQTSNFYDMDITNHEYDIDDYDYSDVLCNECDSYEGDCGCGNDDDEDDECDLSESGVDVTVNPDHDAPGTVDVTALSRSYFVMPADSYTEERMYGSGPFEIISVSHTRDGDGEYAVEYKDASGEPWHGYWNDAMRFKQVDRGDVDRIREEKEAEKEALREAKRVARQERRFVNELLLPSL